MALFYESFDGFSKKESQTKKNRLRISNSPYASRMIFFVILSLSQELSQQAENNFCVT
jgi:hypothetical protein